MSLIPDSIMTHLSARKLTGTRDDQRCAFRVEGPRHEDVKAHSETSKAEAHSEPPEIALEAPSLWLPPPPPPSEVPLLINLTEFGKTPLWTRADQPSRPRGISANCKAGECASFLPPLVLSPTQMQVTGVSSHANARARPGPTTVPMQMLSKMV
jgi:hypothetical protein